MLLDQRREKLEEECQLHYMSTVSAEQRFEVKSLNLHSFFSFRLSFFLTTILYFMHAAHMLGVAASWLVQIVIEAYRCFIRKPNNDEDFDSREKIRLYLKKVYGTTIKCGASLVFASIGAGIGALIHPSTGQWIGNFPLRPTPPPPLLIMHNLFTVI